MLKDIANLHLVDGIDVAFNAVQEVPGVVAYEAAGGYGAGLMIAGSGEKMTLEVTTDPDGFIDSYSFTVKNPGGLIIDFGGEFLDENESREELVDNMYRMIHEWAGE